MLLQHVWCSHCTLFEVRCDSSHPAKTLVYLLYAKVWFTILHLMCFVISLYVLVYPTLCVYIVLCFHELSCYVYGAIRY
jgi:hypothetical protein